MIKLSPEGVAAKVPPAANASSPGPGRPGFPAWSARSPDERVAPPLSSDVHGGLVHVANCRFLMKPTQFSGLHRFAALDCATVNLRNCEFLGRRARSVSWRALCGPAQRLIVDNCLTVGQSASAGLLEQTRRSAAIQLTRNTSGRRHARSPLISDRRPGNAPGRRCEPEARSAMETSANIFDGANVLLFQLSCLPARVFAPTEAEAILTQLARLAGRAGTSTAAGRHLLRLGTSAGDTAAGTAHQDPRRLEAVLGNGRSRVRSKGSVRYQGGDLLAKAGRAPEQLTPEDFRLRPDSAGYRAGKDGKDLGADVDLVGPGPAYERWKKTPEYQQWLKDTRQLKAEAPKPEPKAFVVLGGKGVEVRKFDTLAEAVQGASDGDTIEIRGNGPFVTEPITIKQARTDDPGRRGLPAGHQATAPKRCRGGDPAAHERPAACWKVWTSHVALQTLEGLDCITAEDGPLAAANCRFLEPECWPLYLVPATVAVCAQLRVLVARRGVARYSSGTRAHHRQLRARRPCNIDQRH